MAAFDVDVVTYPPSQAVLQKGIDSLYEKIGRLQKPERPWGLERIRKLQSLRQRDVARAMGVSQPKISLLENSTSITLGELAGFVQACGGMLEVGARLPNGHLVPLRVKTGGLPPGLNTSGR